MIPVKKNPLLIKLIFAALIAVIVYDFVKKQQYYLEAMPQSKNELQKKEINKLCEKEADEARLNQLVEKLNGNVVAAYNLFNQNAIDIEKITFKKGTIFKKSVWEKFNVDIPEEITLDENTEFFVVLFEDYYQVSIDGINYTIPSPSKNKFTHECSIKNSKNEEIFNFLKKDDK